MKTKTYGFLLGENKHPHEIKETTEKKALIKLVQRHWKDITETEKIELLGEVLTNSN